MYVDVIQFLAVVFSIAGAIFIARHEVRFLGFFIWIISNILWIAAGIVLNNPYIIGLFIAYFISNIAGVYDEWENRWHSIQSIKTFVVSLFNR